MKISDRIALLKAGYTKEEIRQLIEEESAADSTPIEKADEPALAPSAADTYMTVLKTLADEVKGLKAAVQADNVSKTSQSGAPAEIKPEDILGDLFKGPASNNKEN